MIKEELEKENAELKSENQKWKYEWQEQVQKATDEGYARTLQTIQLTKAKELLKQWLQTSKASGCDNINIVTDTEQFISEVEKMTEVKRTERGWAGHFICSDSCKFRRNTILECEDKAIVVSTVGAMYDEKGNLQEIGIHRHYETKCFYVDETSGEYKDADVSREIFPEGKWALKWHKDGYIDNEANKMHENIVTEMTAKLLKGEL